MNENLTLTDVIIKVHRDYPRVMAGTYGTIVLVFLMILLVLWMIFGTGPRRRRGMRAARSLLKSSGYKAALDQLKQVRAIGSPSAGWIKTFDEFEAECLQAASDAALKEKKFEDALEFGQRAA